MKRLQDLLGDVHDLDVLRAALRRHTSRLDPRLTTKFRERVKAERKARLAEFSTQDHRHRIHPSPSLARRLPMGARAGGSAVSPTGTAERLIGQLS